MDEDGFNFGAVGAIVAGLTVVVVIVAGIVNAVGGSDDRPSAASTTPAVSGTASGAEQTPGDDEDDAAVASSSPSPGAPAGTNPPGQSVNGPGAPQPRPTSTRTTSSPRPKPTTPTTKPPVTHPSPTVYVHCEPRSSQYYCVASLSAGLGTLRWRVNGSPQAAFDDQLTLATGCSYPNNAGISVEYVDPYGGKATGGAYAMCR